MSTELIGAVGVAILLVIIFLGVPVWLSMVLVGTVGYVLAGGGAVLHMIGSTTRSVVMDFTFSVLPIFLLMGEFADISGMMKDAYNSANIWLSKIKGGLAMASILGAAAFSTVSGSSPACAAIMSRIALPQLLHHKYDPALSVGALAAGGTLGNLIPPGILLIIYALMAEVSLGKLFIACYIPGFLLMFMYLVQIYIQCTLNPLKGPVAGSFTWKEKLLATKGIVPVAVVLAVTLGGIQIGVFTPNEAASICTVFVFILALMRRTLNGQNMLQAFKSTLATTGMALALIAGAQIFNVFIAITQMPQALAGWLTSVHLSQIWIIIFIMILYFIMGIPLSGMTIMLLTLPILLPVLKAYQVDLLWFGVLTMVQCELAAVTPPVGITLFIVAAMSKPLGISMSTVFRGAIPFCVTCVVFLIILITFPPISTFLVSLMLEGG